MASSCSSALVLLLLGILAGLDLCLGFVSGNNILYTNRALCPGQSLTQGCYSLIMQADCNLVLYDAGKVAWSTNTSGRGFSSCLTVMRSDGNLAVYSRNPYWDTLWMTDFFRPVVETFALILQPDRDLVIYGPALWSTGTNTTNELNYVNECLQGTKEEEEEEEHPSPSIATF